MNQFEQMQHFENNNNSNSRRMKRRKSILKTTDVNDENKVNRKSLRKRVSFAKDDELTKVQTFKIDNIKNKKSKKRVSLQNIFNPPP